MNLQSKIEHFSLFKNKTILFLFWHFLKFALEQYNYIFKVIVIM